MGIAGPHPGGAPARRRKRRPTGAGAPTPRGGGGGGAQSDSAYRLGKVLGAILHGVVERKRGSRGGDDVDIGGIGWVNVNVDSSFTPDPPIVSDMPVQSVFRHPGLAGLCRSPLPLGAAQG